MDLTTIHTTIRHVLAERKEYLQLLENTFREQMCSADLATFLSNKISLKHQITSFKHALEVTASTIRDDGDIPLSNILWNPILASTLDLLCSTEVHHSLRSTLAERPDRKKTSSTTLKQQPQRPALVEKPVCHDDVYRQLDDYLQRNPAPYSTVPHIRCDHAGCRFCLGMFNGIQLTKCSNHKPCVPLGWFPHVGKPLWNSLRKKHTPERAFVNPPRSVKDCEIPNRAHAYRTASPPANTSWADEMDNVLPIPVDEDTNISIPSNASSAGVSIETMSIRSPDVASTAAGSSLSKYRPSEQQDDILFRSRGSPKRPRPGSDSY